MTMNFCPISPAKIRSKSGAMASSTTNTPTKSRGQKVSSSVGDSSPPKCPSKQKVTIKTRSNSDESSSSLNSSTDSSNLSSSFRGRSTKLSNSDADKMLKLLESMQANGCGGIRQKRRDEANGKIQDAMQKTYDSIKDIEKRKAENLQLAKERLYSKDSRSSETANRVVASLCMERYYNFDPVIKQLMSVLQALKTIEWNLDDGRIMPEEVDSDIQYILSMADKPIKNQVKYTQEELLEQLQKLS